MKTIKKPYTVINDQQMLWGKHFLPLKPKAERAAMLRIVLFVSCECGTNMLRQLLQFEALYPEKLFITGVVTDDPVDPAARISLKKRVWSQFQPEERAAIFAELVDEATSHGLSCYSGAVKTDYFRAVFGQWHPDALIMFCFGQKIDAPLYDSPPAGAYNFHPSDLPKKIGLGTQPFQNAMQNGLKSAPMVIHRVTELIDIGPIVGVSPHVNICLADGSYPVSVRTLLDKITSIGGWMGVELVDALIKANEQDYPSCVTSIDFDTRMDDNLKAMLRKPALNDLNEKYCVPLHPLLQHQS